MYKKGDFNYTHVGKRFGVNAATIKKIVTFTTWKERRNK